MPLLPLQAADVAVVWQDQPLPAAPPVGRHLSPRQPGFRPTASYAGGGSMFGVDYILALMLLQGADVSALSDARVAACWHAMTGKPMMQLALAGEILDPREVRYVLVKADEFVSDLRMLQRRAHDLRQAPRLADSVRFPERTIVNELLLFNRAYRQHIENCLPLYPNNAELRAARDEVEQLYQVWDCVRDARCEYYYVHIRRQALKRLYEMLGEADYLQSNLPPHVPVWRFTPVR